MEQNRMQKRVQRTRTRLLQAALTAFREKGVEATTIEDLTERADLGKGTFYRHFASKEDIVVALISESVRRLVQEIRKSVGARQGLPEVLAGLLQAHTTFFMHHREEFVLLFQGRLLLKLEREDPVGLEQPFLDYLGEVEARVRPFMPLPVDTGRVRRVACGLAGFVSGYLSFAMIGLAEGEIEASFGSLRTAFVAACSAMLATLPTSGAVAAPATSPKTMGASK
jgi:AcrR family transcriptional regulator